MDRDSVEAKVDALLTDFETAQMNNVSVDYPAALLDAYLKILLVMELRQIALNIDGLRDTIRAQGR
ncbi:MAG TPA: hypothetical protein DDW42_01690 [Desulfobacteraceae bacterium]|nr:hypothetical protein [Desulfobacteraceae bacterium]